MAIPFVKAGEVARAAEQNALISQVNTNTNGIASNASAIDSAGGTLSSHASRITALENEPAGTTAGTYFGQWTDANNGGGTILSAPSNGTDAFKGLKITDITVPVGTPVGCSMSNGTFTAQQSGLWNFNFSVQYSPSSVVRAIFLVAGSANVFGSGARLGILAGPSMDAISTSCMARVNAGQSYSVYSACWTAPGRVDVWRQLSNNLTATWLGP